MMYGNAEPTPEEWQQQLKDQEEWREQYGAVTNICAKATPTEVEKQTIRCKLPSMALHHLSARRTVWCDIEFARTVEEACAKAWGITLIDA